MITHTNSYTVTGTGRAECSTRKEYDDLKAALSGGTDKFTLATDDEARLVVDYDIHITITERGTPE